MKGEVDRNRLAGNRQRPHSLTSHRLDRQAGSRQNNAVFLNVTTASYLAHASVKEKKTTPLRALIFTSSNSSSSSCILRTNVLCTHTHTHTHIYARKKTSWVIFLLLLLLVTQQIRRKKKKKLFLFFFHKNNFRLVDVCQWSAALWRWFLATWFYYLSFFRFFPSFSSSYRVCSFVVLYFFSLGEFCFVSLLSPSPLSLSFTKVLIHLFKKHGPGVFSFLAATAKSQQSGRSGRIQASIQAMLMLPHRYCFVK